MPSFGCAPARLVGVVVLLGASLAACYDSRRIIFEPNLPDAGGAGGSPPLPQSQATGAAPAAALPVGGQPAAAPGSLEATALGADPSPPLDAGVAIGALDAGAPDASP